MNSIYRSILARSVMTGAASLAFMMMGPAWVRAETVIVQGGDGAAGADGVNLGDPGLPAATESRWPPTQAAHTRSLPHSIHQRRPPEMGAKAAMAQAATACSACPVATVAMAALRVRWRRRLSSPARRKRAPILWRKWRKWRPRRQ